MRMSSLVMRRIAAVLAVCLFFAIATVLLLADRSASIVAMLRTAVVDLGQRVEQTYDIDVIDRGDIPGTFDQIGHAVLWGTGMLIVGFALRRRVPIALTAMCMAGASIVFEVAQPVLSTSRVFERSDAVGNLTGVVSAAVLLWAGLALASAFLSHRPAPNT